MIEAVVTAMPEHSELRTELASYLRSDATRHRQGRFPEIGSQFLEFEEHVCRALPLEDTIVIAYSFWDAWLDERNHGWIGFYSGITENDWPQLADELAAALERGSEVRNPILVKLFGPSGG